MNPVKIKCPRCGLDGYLISEEKALKGGRIQTYYFVVHRKKGEKTRKCAVGSEEYIYVSRTHTLPGLGISIHLSNIISIDKLAELVLQALESLEESLENMSEEQLEKIGKVREYIAKYSEIINRLNEIVSKSRDQAEGDAV